MVKSVCCARCSSGATARKREFSEQAYSMLLVWGEIDKDIIDAPICDECYAELRDLLIERADDAIEEDTVATPVQIKRIVGIPTTKAEVIPLARASGSDLVETGYTPKAKTARVVAKKEKVSNDKTKSKAKTKTQKSSSKKTDTKSKSKSKTVSKSKVKTTTKPSKKVSSSKVKKPVTKGSKTTKTGNKKVKSKPTTKVVKTKKVISTGKIKKRKVA